MCTGGGFLVRRAESDGGSCGCCACANCEGGRAQLQAAELQADITPFLASMHAAAAEDVAHSGLHPCGLPSCGGIEHSHREFRWCSSCWATKYCSNEHAEADQERHRDECEAAAERHAAAKAAKKAQKQAAA